MGGDEIVTDWLGNVESGVITTSGTVQRFSDASKRFKTVHITNDKFAGVYGFIGKYYSSTGAFGPSAFFLVPGDHLTFEYIDLYELGCLTHTDATIFKWIGINRY